MLHIKRHIYFHSSHLKNKILVPITTSLLLYSFAQVSNTGCLSFFHLSFSFLSIQESDISIIHVPDEAT